MVRENVSKEVTFKQRPEWDERVSHVNEFCGGRPFQALGTANVKEKGWFCAKEAALWLREIEHRKPGSKWDWSDHKKHEGEQTSLLK